MRSRKNKGEVIRCFCLPTVYFYYSTPSKGMQVKFCLFVEKNSKVAFETTHYMESIVEQALNNSPSFP